MWGRMTSRQLPGPVSRVTPQATARLVTRRTYGLGERAGEVCRRGRQTRCSFPIPAAEEAGVAPSSIGVGQLIVLAKVAAVNGGLIRADGVTAVAAGGGGGAGGIVILASPGSVSNTGLISAFGRGGAIGSVGHGGGGGGGGGIVHLISPSATAPPGTTDAAGGIGGASGPTDSPLHTGGGGGGGSGGNGGSGGAVNPAPSNTRNPGTNGSKGHVLITEALPVAGSKKQYEPGDVVVLSKQQPGAVEKCCRPNDVKVAGVYSTRPGLIGADKNGQTRIDESDIPVAITGIVPTKITAESGAIEPGDLLTTSSTPGHAMKAKPRVVDGEEIYRTGSILGKALEPLEKGTGVIKVLITLK